ncbi:MAG: c-type cytochrome [Methylomicrobium sp.]
MRVLPNIVNTALGIILLGGGIGAAQAADPIQTTTPHCIAPTMDATGEGRRTYMRLNCYSCHGSNGHGASMGPSLVGEADEVREAVMNGEGEGMPSFKNNLCPNDLANLTAYVQLLGTGTEPDFLNWWESKPSR